MFWVLSQKIWATVPQVFSGHKTSKEDVDAFSNREGHSDNTIDTRFAVQAANKVGQVVLEHWQTVWQVVSKPNTFSFLATYVCVDVRLSLALFSCLEPLNTHQD